MQVNEILPRKKRPSDDCLWCGAAFEARNGGKRQRFCRPLCRTAFHSASRRWAERAIASGALSIADLRSESHSRAGI